MSKKNPGVELPVMRVKEFDILVPANQDVLQRHIGLLATTETQEVLIPLTYEAAKAMADMIAKTLMLEAPELYFPAHVVKELKSGKLSLEQLKDLI